MKLVNVDLDTLYQDLALNGVPANDTGVTLLNCGKACKLKASVQRGTSLGWCLVPNRILLNEVVRGKIRPLSVVNQATLDASNFDMSFHIKGNILSLTRVPKTAKTKDLKLVFFGFSDSCADSAKYVNLSIKNGKDLTANMRDNLSSTDELWLVKKLITLSSFSALGIRKGAYAGVLAVSKNVRVDISETRLKDSVSIEMLLNALVIK